MLRFSADIFMANPQTPKPLEELLEKSRRLNKEAEKVKLAGLIQKSQRLRQEAEETARNVRELEKSIDRETERTHPKQA